MNCQLGFNESDILALPFKEGDAVMFGDKEKVIREIYLRKFNDVMNDIIIVLQMGIPHSMMTIG